MASAGTNLLAAVAFNDVEDALERLSLKLNEAPFTLFRRWKLIRTAGQAQTAAATATA